MKVIDLLNKIANGEEVPEEIIYKGKTYYAEFNSSSGKSYYYDDENNLLLESIQSVNQLNELIKEDKKIEKLEHWVDVKSWVKGNDLEKGLEEQSEFNKNIYYKINEIIDYLEEKK